MQDNELPGWQNGRRRGLKIPREKSHVGSIPTPGTSGFHEALFGGLFPAVGEPGYGLELTAELIVRPSLILSERERFCMSALSFLRRASRSGNAIRGRS